MTPKTMKSGIRIISIAMVLPFFGSAAWAQNDMVLTHTLEPATNEVIDCKGGAIRPAVPASVSGGIAVPSEPDTLIYLEDVRGVNIRNCVLEDATFGIIAVGGGGHKIRNNTIEAASTAVGILASHDNRIKDNALSATVSSVGVTNGSTGNLILDNELTFRPGPDQPFGPGIPALAGYQYQLITGSYPLGGVLNIIVNGELRQVPATTDNFTENTVVSGNSVNNDGGTNGIGFAVRSRGSIAISNTVQGGQVGLGAFGYPDGAPGPFTVPGTCSADPGRYCASDADCDIPGFDSAPLGTCDGATLLFTESRRSIAPEFVDNTVTGASSGIVAAWTDGVLIEGNDVRDNFFGIDIFGGYALEDGTVRGNIVSGNIVGLGIFNIFGQSASLDVSFNDFGDNAVPFDAIQLELPANVLGPYTLPTSLPNNWWGTDCAEGGFPSGPQWPNTTDPSPFAEPVAEAYRRNVNKTRKLDRCW